MRMAEGGVTSQEYRTFLEQPSGNMDDSGFFSIQVISNALGVWGLELILFNSPEYQRLMIEAVNEKAFICNYKEHWFTVRKLGQQWFNLNSLLTGPELISDTYLALFLAQLQQEGYSIFVIRGDLPDCEADQILGIVRVEQTQRPKLIGEEAAQSSSGQSVPMESAMEISTGFQTGPVDEDEENLRKALALSRQDIEVEDEEADLRRAIQLSMLGAVGGSSLPDPRDGSIAHSSRSIQNETLTAEELRKRRQAYFDKQSQQQAQPTSQPQPQPLPEPQPQPQPQLQLQPQPQLQQESKSTGQCIDEGKGKREAAPKSCKTQDLSSEDKPTVNDLASKNIDFAMNLYRKIASQNDDNIFFSPLCISSAFAMLSLGAKGNTYDQIIKGLILDLLQSKDNPNVVPALFRQQQENITSSQDLDLTQGACKTQDLSSEDKPTVNDLASKNIDFAMNLYRKIASQNDDNIFFSPLCISSAFTMLSLGAKGNTYDQIIKGLNLDLLQSKDNPNVIPALFRQQQENITSSQDLDLTQGGAMFVPQDFNVLETFLSQTKEYFNTDAVQLNPILTTSINEYVEKKTNGKIKELLKTVDPNTKLMLINYVLFKGKWEEPFDANYTEQARFYVNNYRIVSVPMMFRSDKFKLGYDDKLKLSILKLPYRGDASMIVLLPDKDADYNSIDEEISAERFYQWLRMLKKMSLACL
ncbi:UNVERIFIED_CONTAM: hypothetical protein FKN15_029846 [Acipenser sinensis]